jgi:CRISPR-associated endonuclease Csn1
MFNTSGMKMADKNTRYRFAFDMGTNSLGWAVYELNQALVPIDITDTGVRIFSDGRDPQSKASLAEQRRGPRSARRLRDRYLQRRQYLMTELIKARLMPPEESARKALEALDPYDLRRKGLNEALTPYEFGRTLFHLNQRRGFQSNRIADAGADEEGGKIKQANIKLKAALNENNCRTFGEFLAKRHDNRESVRIRLRGKDAKAHYDFYPTRDLLKDEFVQLWASQARHHTSLDEPLKAHFHKILFFQRPLKAPIIGKCTFFHTEERQAKSHPLSQLRRIYQDLNHLRLKEGGGLDERQLTLSERDTLAQVLLMGVDITFKTGLRKYLKHLPTGTVTTIEEGGRADRLVADQLAFRLGQKGPLKHIWGNLTPEQRTDIALRLNTEQNEAALIDYLKDTYGLDDTTAEATIAVRLPNGYDNLGETATAKIIDALKAEVITYDKAVLKALGKHHSDERDGEILDALPYYGQVLSRHTLGGSGNPSDKPDKQFGRISNPTVHVALNQLKRVINALIREYGHPEQIVIELARDLKMSLKQKDELEKTQKDNQKKNEARKLLLEEAGYPVNAGNMILLRLWEELGPPMQRVCVYTNRPIGLKDLLSGEFEIEHILPYSRTLDDTMANKTLAAREANRGKRNQSPAEAFKDDEYEAIRQRAKILPPNKRWRFDPDAMERFENTERDFLARQLNETRHLATLSRKYLTKITDPDQVWVVTGQMTALLRARFGLNSLLSDHNTKNRTDHRHHAIDACVIGICDRRLLQGMSNEAKKYEYNNELKDITRHIPEPFADFRDKLKAKIDTIIVSHKPEHGTGGALHNDTSYGINQAEDRSEGELITRKAIDALTYNEIDKVRDLNLRSKLQALRKEVGKDAKALAKALDEFGTAYNVRRVRILKTQKDFIPIKHHKTGEAYRAVIPGENHHMDIIEGPDGVWRGFAASVFDANQAKSEPKWKLEYPGAKLVMRVHKGDLLELMDDDGIIKIKKVVKIEPSSNRITLAEHKEAGTFQKRHDDAEDPFRWDFANIGKLKSRQCKLYIADELGKPKAT